MSKSSWLRSIGSQGGWGTPTTHVAKSTKPEPTISNADTSSNYTSDPREEVWPTDDSFNIAPDFSDPMSDNISEGYQSLEQTRATQMMQESSEEGESQTHTSKWLQELFRNSTHSDVDDSRPWSYSNKTMNEIDNADGQGCSNTKNAQKATNPASEITAITLQKKDYVGGMNYAKTGLLKAVEPRASAKGRKVRPPALLAQTAATGPDGTSRSASPSSEATSKRSSAYRAIYEAAIARKALLQAQLEAEKTAARLSADMEEGNCEHQAVAAEIETIQNELRLSTERQAKGQGKQAAEMNAMEHRIMEINDLLIQRERRMESQMQEKCSQIQTMGSILKDVQPQTEHMILMV